MTTYTDLGITYTIDPTAELTAFVSSALTDINGARTILSSVDISDLTYFVTSIGPDAFKDCATMTSITIPDSITSIEAGAFAGCSTLDEIIFENAELSILGDGIFVGATAITSVLLTITNTTLTNNVINIKTQINAVSVDNAPTYIYIYPFNGITYTTDNEYNGSITSVVTSLLTSDSAILDGLDIGTTGDYTRYDVTTIASSVKSQHTGLTDATITDDPTFFSARAQDFRYIMSTMSLEYYTSEFETSIATIKATIYEQITTPAVSRTATSTIPYDSIKNAFQYLPGAATDPMFRLVLGDDYPHLGFSTSEAKVINSVSGNIVTIGNDWLHNLSKYTFGTWDQGDKFLNGTVASNLDPAFKSAFKVNLDNEADRAAKTPFESSVSIENIYNTILYYDSQRLNKDKEVLAISADAEPWLIVPVAVGDKISFLVTVIAHQDQVIVTSNTLLQPREYLFEATIVN